MKVLQVHTHYRQAGGEDAVVAAEAALLRSDGHSVVEWRNKNPEDAVAAGAALALAPLNPVQSLRLARTARQEQPDVAHVHNTWFATSPWSIRSVKRSGVPVVMTLHNYRLTCASAELLRDGSPCELCVGTNPWHAVKYSCYNDSKPMSAVAASTIALHQKLGTWSDSVDRFAALTEFAKSRLVAGGLPEHKVVVKPNFVADPGPRTTAAELSTTVLFVGRLSGPKGVKTLVDAWEKQAPPGLTLKIAGTGPLEEELKSRDVPGVEMLGWTDPADIKALMLSARALVFPSTWYEGMPVTLLEAFAAGLPVLGSSIGSVEEIVSPLGDQWTITPGSTDAWVEGLAMLGDGAAVRAASAKSRELYEGSFSLEAGLANLKALYAGL